MEHAIAHTLEMFTVQHSNFQHKRNYISMSHSHLEAPDLLKQWFEGFKADKLQKLKCYKGYQMERDLVARLKATYGDRVQTGIEYSAFNGLVKGHPDFEFDGYPGDCKSVLMDDWIPGDGKLPLKVFKQLQAYMLYGKKDRALVIYESRENGQIYAKWLKAVPHVQAYIDKNFSNAVSQIPCAS